MFLSLEIYMAFSEIGKHPMPALDRKKYNAHAHLKQRKRIVA